MSHFFSDSRKQAWKRHKFETTTLEKYELERYLEDDIVDEIDDPGFDNLNWWNTNLLSYKILSVMVRDVLAIPVSTVASESCFSTSGRVLDVFCSSLSPRMVEALICTQNWMNPAGLKCDDTNFDQFDSNDKIIDDVAAKIQGGKANDENISS
ncbi:hypothetical protein QQ045_015606 [Rhodiola kirilowii]